MNDRRAFLQIALALGCAGLTYANAARALATQRLSQDDVLRFEALGQVTLLHVTDLHAQLVPIYYREPALNVGAGAAFGQPPHLSGSKFLEHFGIAPGNALAYLLASEDFVALAAAYGRVGGLDRLATLVEAIRAERPNQTLLLDGGDTWAGSYTALQSRGADMVTAMNALGVDAMTGHWEFTYGEQRVKELIAALKFPFLAGNVFDSEWDEPVFPALARFERGGVPIAVLGQAYPYTPIAHPRHMIRNWSFGIHEQRLQAKVDAARAAGARLVVLLSHNGFDVDHKLARRVHGIDVILGGHTHDALPAAIEVDKTLLIASGSHGKFLSRLDLDVGPAGVRTYRYRLMPVLTDAIAPQAQMSALIAQLRAPHRAQLGEVLAHNEALLYRRGNLNGTFDDLICQALRVSQDTEIALSPGFRWGSCVLPGQPITREDVYNQTAITYPAVYRNTLSGAQLKDILEDVADNLFNPDPYFQQGGDMVRVAGLGFELRAAATMGARITKLVHLPGGEPLQANKHYSVAGWASVQENVQGPAIYDLLEKYLRAQGTVSIAPSETVRIV